MTYHRKVDLIQLETLLHSGLSMKAIAEKFHVNKSNISRNVALLRDASAKDIVLRSAEKLNTKKLNVMTRLEKIMTVVEDELSYIQTAIKDTKGDERRQWEKAQIEHSAEIRKQLGLLREICQTLYNIEEVEGFRKTVLSVIGGVNEEIRDEILRRLRARRTAGNAFGPGEFGV